MQRGSTKTPPASRLFSARSLMVRPWSTSGSPSLHVLTTYLFRISSSPSLKSRHSRIASLNSRLKLNAGTARPCQPMSWNPFAVGDHCHALHFGAIFLSETRPGWIAPLGSTQRRMEVDIGRSLLRVQDAPRLAAFFSRLFPAGKLVTSG